MVRGSPYCNSPFPPSCNNPFEKSFLIYVRISFLFGSLLVCFLLRELRMTGRWGVVGKLIKDRSNEGNVQILCICFHRPLSPDGNERWSGKGRCFWKVLEKQAQFSQSQIGLCPQICEYSNLPPGSNRCLETLPLFILYPLGSPSVNLLFILPELF